VGSRCSCAFRTAVGRRDADQQIVRRGLGILDEDIEVPPFFENAGILQLELRLIAASAAIFFDQ